MSLDGFDAAQALARSQEVQAELRTQREARQAEHNRIMLAEALKAIKAGCEAGETWCYFDHPIIHPEVLAVLASAGFKVTLRNPNRMPEVRGTISWSTPSPV